MSAHLLREKGLRVTQSRIAVLEILQQRAGQHMTPEDLVNHLESQGQRIALATVYRVLDFLLQHHMVIKTQTPHQKTYYE